MNTLNALDPAKVYAAIAMILTQRNEGVKVNVAKIETKTAKAS